MARRRQLQCTARSRFTTLICKHELLPSGELFLWRGKNGNMHPYLALASFFLWCSPVSCFFTCGVMKEGIVF
jgi:hypothetical protein